MDDKQARIVSRILDTIEHRAKKEYNIVKQEEKAQAGTYPILNLSAPLSDRTLRRQKAALKKRSNDRWLYLDTINYPDGMDGTDEELKMVSYILWRNYMFKEGRKFLFVDLLSSDLQDKFKSQYKTIRDVLVNKEYIQVLPGYAVNKHARGYRIHPKWINSPIISKKLNRVKITRHNDISNLQSELEIKLHTMQTQLIIKKDPLTIEARNQSTIREAMGLHACQQIYAGNINQKKGKKTNRIYDTFTNCPKEYRGCFGVKIDDKEYPIVSVDYCSFHPYLIHTKYDEINDDGCEYEKAKYMEALECDIYLFLKPENMSRDVAKKQLTAFLAGGRKINNRMSRSFKVHFPILHNYIVTTPNVASDLQNLEAAIVIGEVARICIERGIWVKTIHDNIVTIPMHMDEVMKLMEDVCYNRFGVIPRTKVENFDI